MDLEKFWLGNVNEKGDVDQEGYDKETLEIVNTKVSCLKQKLVDGVVDENDTQPQEADEDELPLEKEATAVDYSHENETVEDDTPLEEIEERERNYRRAELAFQNSVRGGPSTEVAKRVIDDDYDDEESESEDKAAPGQQKGPSAPDPPDAQANNAPASGQAPGQPAAPIQPASQVPSQATDGHPASAEAPIPPDTSASESQQEQPAKSDSIRKHGLLLFSEMFLFPSIQPRIARTRWPADRLL